MNDTPLLQIKNLSKTYTNQNESIEILKGVDLTIHSGEFVCFLGPSGCGKTTTLRCIAGFECYDGEIYMNENAVKEPGIDRMMVFQDFNQLFPWKTVAENIQFPLKVQGLKDKKKLTEITNQSLKKVRLDGYQKYYPHQLSGGMKQRVAIAKAFAVNSKLILMDEPFAALDAITRNKLQAELSELALGEHFTVIFVTHNIQEALVLGSRIIVFSNNGKIKLDEENPLPKPVTPATPGYSDAWKKFNFALNN